MENLEYRGVKIQKSSYGGLKLRGSRWSCRKYGLSGYTNRTALERAIDRRLHDELKPMSEEDKKDAESIIRKAITED